jgi:DNA-binding IclR family transcriptional regulator
MTSAAIVERHDAGTYTLGIRLLELGNIVKSRINIRQVALPFMQQLHELIGEAVNLGIRHEDEIIYVERTSSGRSLVRVVYLVGGRAPLHLTSVGKLFLAADGLADVRAYARRTGLPGKTPHSLTRLDALEKELDKIRRHEFAYDNEEAEIGLRCLAAPVRNDEGQLVAGLSISRPATATTRTGSRPIKATANEIIKGPGPIANHQLGCRRRLIGATQSQLHVPCNGSGHQQHVGMARAGNESNAEALDVVVGVIEGVDFEFASVAGTGIDFANAQSLAENCEDFALNLLAVDAQGIVARGRGFAADAVACDLSEDAPHQRSCPE